MEHTEQIPIHNGEGIYSKDIGRGKTIKGNLTILSPDDGTWDIKFYDKDKTEVEGKLCGEDSGIKKDKPALLPDYEMEHNLLVIYFKWSEHRDTTLKVDIKHEVNNNKKLFMYSER